MDWISLVGPAVVAAVISALVAWATTSRRFAVDRELAERKINTDIGLAERKFAFDNQLAERKAALDANLAERKFAFDRDLAVWRRRFDIAEQVLAAAYEARDALIWARGRGIFSGEGKTRVAVEVENSVVKEARDSAYVPIERLEFHLKAFVTLQTLQDSIMAHFGHDAAKPIAEIFAVRYGITNAAGILIQQAALTEQRSGGLLLQPLREELHGTGAALADSKLADAIQQLEAICKPILSGQGPT